MKRYFTYILSFVLISCIAACTKSEDVVNPNAEGHMALRLVSSTMTRATTPGNGVGTDVNDDANNEDAILSADLYFYPSSKEGAAKLHKRISFVKEVESEEGTDTQIQIENETATISNLAIPADVMQDVFGSGTTGYVYVVANAPEGFQSPETDLPTLAALKAKVVSTDSWKTSETNATDPSSAQTSFVMAGDATVTKSGNSVSGEVFLTRAAAKIELSITDVVQSVTVEGETWAPVLGDGNDGSTIFVSLNYAVGGSYIDGAYDKAKFANDNTQQNYGFVKPDKDKKAYNQAYPFYSYASDWGAGGANEPYLLLVVPWVKNGSTTKQSTFYQIPVGSLDAKQIKRNHYYKVKINVGTMGSFEPQTATEITPSYTVIDWSTGSISTDIKEASYLVVDENEVVMNNVTSYGVGYQSSHDVSVSIIGFSCKYYNNGSLVTVNNNYPANTTSIKDVAPNLTDLTFKVDVEGGKIVLEHNLDNTMPDKTYHYFPYEITVQVTNPALPGNPEIIVFKQYPAMYVDVYRQTDGSKVMINGNGTKSSSTSGSTYQWWYLNQSLNSTSNAVGDHAKDMFTVSVSAFDASTSQYIIGDPRAEAEDLTLWQTDEDTGENTSTRVSTFKDKANNEVIKGYRATIVGPTAKDIIAPKFIVASGYGAHSLNHDLYPGTSGKYRCATYQEAGYPAGRWRVPTPAELEIIGRMCAEGKLASIFYANGSTTYASSNGGYLYNVSSGTGTFEPSGNMRAVSIRCVYDVWYWGDKLKSDQEFIWGAEGNIKDMKANGTYDTYFTTAQ